METELTVVASSHSRDLGKQRENRSDARLSTSGPPVQHPIVSSETLPSQDFKPVPPARDQVQS